MIYPSILIDTRCTIEQSNFCGSIRVLTAIGVKEARNLKLEFFEFRGFTAQHLCPQHKQCS